MTLSAGVSQAALAASSIDDSASERVANDNSDGATLQNAGADNDEQEVANRGNDEGEGNVGDDTDVGYTEALQTFKDTTALAVERNLEMMTVQVEYGTWLSAAKMRVNPV